jgi:hypothetical protein
MSNERNQAKLVVKRFPISFLSEVVYFAQPMSRELAETIRTLRRDHLLGYSEVMWALAEPDPDIAHCIGYGKALTELACRELNDFDPNWK